MFDITCSTLETFFFFLFEDLGSEPYESTKATRIPRERPGSRQNEFPYDPQRQRG